MTTDRYARIPVWSWILVPGLISLLVTIVRLVGELNQWPELFFGRAAGGGGAIVGIVWLIPIFGIYFGLKLARSGYRPASTLKTILLVIAAFALLVVSGLAGAALGLSNIALIPVYAIASLAAAYIAHLAWPVMGRIQLAYALVARIPVALIMLIAIYGNWGTHYDAPPPGGLPEMGPLLKWVLIGLLPQMTTWIAFTMILGAVFGAAAAASMRPKRG